jgi:flagellar protein FliO/FliZ
MLVLGATALVAAGAPTPVLDDAKIFVPGVASPANAAAAGPSLGSVTLLVGLALAGVGTWLVWRARQGAPIGRDARQLSIQETRSLGNRQYLVVAAYENKKFLLGVCPGRIEMLTPLSGSADDEDSRP